MEYVSFSCIQGRDFLLLSKGVNMVRNIYKSKKIITEKHFSNLVET